jgi:hypothetical protein
MTFFENSKKTLLYITTTLMLLTLCITIFALPNTDAHTPPQTIKTYA